MQIAWKTLAVRCKELSKHQDSKQMVKENKLSRCLGTGSPASPGLDNQEFQYPTLWHNILYLVPPDTEAEAPSALILSM